MWIKSKVVMLPAKEYSSLIRLNDELRPNDSSVSPCRHGDEVFNLYFLSDEEIKEGDWCLDEYNQLWSFSGDKLIGFDNQGNKRFSTDNISGQNVKKIIATTDESLWILGKDEYGSLIKWRLPRPTNKFLKKYCDKGGIDEVLVEYDRIDDGDYGAAYKQGQDRELKTLSNNTISIKSVKRTWNKKEVIKLLQQFSAQHGTLSNKSAQIRWIEENT